MMKVVGMDHSAGKGKRRPRRLRSIAVLPTLLTLGNMLCGFTAIYFCLLGVLSADINPAEKLTLNNQLIEQFLPTFVSVGGFLIFLGMFFDMMDGRVARMTSGTTNFGGQLDSLADMVSFGVAPAMLMICLVTLESHASPEEMLFTTRGAWMAGAIYAACCTLRLARFNVEHAEGDLKHTAFHGLPSPAAAAVVASLVILYEHVQEVRGYLLVNLLPVIAIASGVLMVSRIRYIHVGNTYLRGRMPFGHVALLLAAIALLIRFPSPTLAGLAGLYALLGPVAWLSRQIGSWFSGHKHTSHSDLNTSIEKDGSDQKLA